MRRRVLVQNGRVPRSLRHPARLVPLAFLAAIAIGTLLLMLPAARAGTGAAPFVTALFTSTSAVCVTGLIVVDTPTYWSGFGQAVILLLFQVGGFGIMSGATLLGLLVMQRLRLGYRLLAQAETRSLQLGDVVAVLKLILVITVVVEATLALALFARLHLVYGEPAPAAAWNAVFHAVSAFNNAGFSTYSDSLVGFAADPYVILPVALAVVVGGLGFPVLHEIRQERRYRRWSIHTKLTLVGTASLLVLGTAGFAYYEWDNPATLGAHDLPARWMGALFHSVTSRTAGFNALDVAALQPESLTLGYALMFIGGGSAGTAGGIKVTTFMLLGAVVLAEICGYKDTVVFRRRISAAAQRQALSIVLLALGVVGIAVLVLSDLTDFTLQVLMFEAISAFATVGLSTGITPSLPPAGQGVLIALMFIGRVGTITVAAALALRGAARLYRYPEERPIVG